MARAVRAALVQAGIPDGDASRPIEDIKRDMIEVHEALLRQAAEQGAEVVCLPRDLLRAVLSRRPGPQVVRADRADSRRSDDADTRRSREGARRGPGRADLRGRSDGGLLQHGRGRSTRTAATSASTGRTTSRTARRASGRSSSSSRGTWAIPCSRPPGRVGVYICYDRHFPEGARILGLNGAEIVFNPSATVAGLSEYLWKLEQPAHAVANGYYVGAINRVGHEQPWSIGEFYGTRTSATRAGRSSPRRRGTRTRWSWLTSISTRSRRSERPGSSSATGGPRRTTSWSSYSFGKRTLDVRRARRPVPGSGRRDRRRGRPDVGDPGRQPPRTRPPASRSPRSLAARAGRRRSRRVLPPTLAALVRGGGSGPNRQAPGQHRHAGPGDRGWCAPRGSGEPAGAARFHASSRVLVLDRSGVRRPDRAHRRSGGCRRGPRREPGQCARQRQPVGRRASRRAGAQS